jgi:hypothetical protein
MGLVACAAWLCPTGARADTLAFDGVGKGVTGISISGNIGGQNVSYGDVFAGELDWSWLGTPPAGFSSSIYTYCVDILNDVTDQENMTVSTTDLLSQPGVPDAGAKAAWLFNTFAPGINSAPSNAATNIAAAGLQVAIWEALYDTTADLSGGNVTFGFSGITGGLVQLAATSFLTQLYSGPSGYLTSSATWLDSKPNWIGQDQITTVPEPATLLLLTGGAVAMFSRRRRRVAAV